MWMPEQRLCLLWHVFDNRLGIDYTETKSYDTCRALNQAYHKTFSFIPLYFNTWVENTLWKTCFCATSLFLIEYEHGSRADPAVLTHLSFLLCHNNTIWDTLHISRTRIMRKKFVVGAVVAKLSAEKLFIFSVKSLAIFVESRLQQIFSQFPLFCLFFRWSVGIIINSLLLILFMIFCVLFVWDLFV